MKNYFYTIILALSALACGEQKQTVEELVEKGDLEAIRARKNEISIQQTHLQEQAKLLDSAINKLGKEEKLSLVSTLPIRIEPFKHYLELQGDVQTKQNVLIYPEVAGTMERVFVKKGDRVRKGQLLAKINDGGLASQVSQLKTQAALAKTTFERRKRLWDQQIGSEIEYLAAKAEYEASQDAIRQLESQLGKSSITAPFSGIIDDVIKDQGTVVAPGPGSEVFRIVNLSQMYIEVDVPETYISGVKKDKEAIVYFPVLGDSVTTKIRETGNFINPSNRSFTVEIPVPNNDGNVKPNLTAKVSINDYASNKAILIPTAIISENANGQQYVYVAQPNQDGNAVAKRTIIATGKTQDGKVEVLSGLKEGQMLIKEGARSVKDGQKVKILN